MNSSRYSHPEREAIDSAAADWLVAHDRGLSPEEEIEFARWLTTSAWHAKVWQEARAAWGRLDQLAELPLETIMRGHDWKIVAQKEETAALAKPTRRVRWATYWPWAAAAVALVLAPAVLVWTHRVAEVAGGATPAQVVTIQPRHLVLPDGSEVELNVGSEIAEEFTRAERHVRLVRGEAHFKVTKDRARPFVVDASGVMVRAVGTAFNVKLDPANVEVLVTEGTVRLEDDHAGAVIPRVTEELASEKSFLDAGRRAIIPLTPSAVYTTEVSNVTEEEIERALAWQAVWLKFVDMPLDRAAVEFNRLNAVKLVVDSSARDVLVAGKFRADNAAVFVGFLQDAFGVAVERRGDGTILLRKAN